MIVHLASGWVYLMDHGRSHGLREWGHKKKGALSAGEEVLIHVEAVHTTTISYWNVRALIAAPSHC